LFEKEIKRSQNMGQVSGVHFVNANRLIINNKENNIDVLDIESSGDKFSEKVG
jgi:hypothetical protein